MSTNVTLNGTTYAIPAVGDSSWGTVLANYFIALGSGVLQKAGGTFTMTAEADFGATYGFKLAYVKSRATNPSATGILRLGNTEALSWRNAANSADLGLTVNASNQLTYNSVVLASTTGPSFQDSLFNVFDNSDITKIVQLQCSAITTGTTRTLTVPDANDTIVGKATTDIFTNKTFDADGVGNSITNIENADIKAAAAIARNKLAAVTVSRALVSDASGFDAVATTTAVEIGYVNGVTSAIQTQMDLKAALISPSFTTPNIGAATGTSLSVSGQLTSTVATGTAPLVVSSTTQVANLNAATAGNASTVTTNANLTGPITSTGNATAVAAQTGTGSVFVMQATPTLTTPVIGAATGTSLSVSGQLTSTVATGTAPLVVSSTTEVANLKAATATLATTATSATKATNIAGGLGGQVPYQSAVDTTALLANGTAGQVLQSNGTTAAPSWVTAASGGKNYVTNPEATTDTTGWATYADAAGTNPVDGTGGAPASTFARNTTTPLRGTADFLWTHSAANRQGEGFSYDFTIDAADKGKVLQGAFDYKIASGTYADDDLQIWIYYIDGASSTLIQPAPYKIKNHSLAADRMPFEFQTLGGAANLLTYRMIVHVATTTATAYTMQIDNVSVGPNAKLYGSPVTDWVAYTPTFTGFGTASAVTVVSRRVGDSLEIKGIFTTGTVTATEARLSLGFGGVNGGVTTADSSKISTLEIVGYGGRNGTVAANYFGHFNMLAERSVTYLTFGYNTSTQHPISKLNGNVVANGSDTFSFHATVPIAGWSSSVIMSSDAATNVVAASLGNTAGTSVTSSLATIPFATLNYDTDGAFVTDTYTVKVAGKYRVAVLLTTQAVTNSTTQPLNIQIQKNGTAITDVFKYGNGGTILLAEQSSIETDCVAGNTLRVQASNSNTIGLNTTVGRNTLIISRISGPAQIAASDTVAAAYYGNPPTGTISAAFNTITFPTKISDTHNAYASGTYTVPVSGTYAIAASCQQNATYVAGNDARICVYIDGAAFACGMVTAGGANGSLHPIISLPAVRMLAGALMTIKTYNSGTAPALAATGQAGNWFTIQRMGNY